MADEDRVMVGTIDGKVLGYSLRSKGPKGEVQIRDKPVEELGWQTGGPVYTLPLSAEHMIAFGSSDGRVYVVMNNERTPLYRIRTGGPIGDGLGSYGTRTLLIPSADDNLYAVDLLTSENIWVFPSGAPIDQAPLVAGEDIFSINEGGYLTLLDPANGNVRWNTLTPGGRLLAVGGTQDLPPFLGQRPHHHRPQQRPSGGQRARHESAGRRESSRVRPVHAQSLR